MTTGPIVSVRGESVVEAEPEIASLYVAARAAAYKRDDALAELSARLHALGEVLDRHAAAIERRESSGISIYPEFDKPGRVSRYVGNVSMSVTLHDFAVVSDIVIACASVPETTVHGPTWALRPASDVYRQARLAAVGDAVRRAREYAAAFGCDLVELVAVNDEGMSGGAMPMMAARSVTGFAAGATTFDFEPQRQEVRGLIEVRFAMSTPDLQNLPG